MRYRIRVFYRIRNKAVLQKYKDRFNCIVSVNYESIIVTDEGGKNLLLDTEKRGFITIRGIEEL